MHLFNEKFETLEDLYWHQLRDLYDAEHRALKALPDMVEAATNPALKAAFTDHIAETKTQATRLEQIFKRHGKDPKRESCAAMKGIVEEGSQVVKADAPGPVKDHALVLAAQRVEHYELAGYGGVKALAHRCGFHEDVQTLQLTLDEEGSQDKRLTHIAEEELSNQPVHS